MASNFRDWSRLFSTMQGVLAAVLLMSLTSAAHAANQCPWMNQATASGLLEGEANIEYSKSPAGQAGICTFIDREASLTRTLTIQVEVSPAAHQRVEEFAHACGGQSEPVPAVGNEANLCTSTDRKGMREERIVGRVRDQVFSIVLGTSSKNDSARHADMLRMHLLSAAEQVSGGLF